MLDQILFKKQIDSCNQASARLNIWQGSVSSGKTYNSIWKWLSWLANEAPKTGDFLMCGKTERTLNRNILNPIIEMIGSKRFRVNRGSAEAFFCDRRIYLAGANDERAQDKIRGLTLAGAYIDEVTLTPESFFTMLLSRLRVRGARLYGTTNPDSPYHWFKTGYLDREGEINLKSFFFHREDNTTLDSEYVASIKQEYTGLWYRRFINGEWCQAEGAIYDMWDEAKHTISRDALPKRYDKVFASCDYGTNNPFVVGLYGVVGNVLYKIKEFHYDSRKHNRQKTNVEYVRDVASFLDGFNYNVMVIDPSAASFKVECATANIRTVDADNDVKNGIQLQASLLASGRLFVCADDCPETVKEIPNYIWDKRAQIRGEDAPLKVDDHHCDETRYACMYAFPLSKTEFQTWKM